MFSAIQMRIKFHFYKIKSTKIRIKDSNKYLTVTFCKDHLWIFFQYS